MKEYICIESPNEVEGGLLVRKQELIRCKGCKFYGVCVLSNAEDGFCAWAEPKGEQ